MEREVDIRKRVATVFNRREDEFETLRAWNDYLNDVEDITFNLVNDVDLEETNRRLEAYQKGHEQEIVQNASLAEQERAVFEFKQKAELEQAKLRRSTARREEADERREIQETRRDVLKRLELGMDAEQVTKAGQEITLKKRMDRQAAAERQRRLQATSALEHGNESLTINGLRRGKSKRQAPVDPFGGQSFGGNKYFSLQDEYMWAGVQETRADAMIGAGGYSVEAFTGRALAEAFAGLGLFFGEDVETRASKDT